MKQISAVLLTLLLVGCQIAPESSSTPGDWFNTSMEAGPWAVKRVGPSILDAEQGTGALEYVAYHPDGDGAYPLIVFSHGSLCDFDANESLSRYWASHGYVVVQPRHLDSAPATFESGLDPVAVWERRRSDLRVAVDRIDDVLALAPAWRGKLDRSITVAAGHSYGGLTAQATAGAQTGAFQGAGDLTRFDDERFDLVVAIAPPGPMGQFVTEATGRLLSKPMIVVVGTNDQFPPMWPSWESHRVTYDSAPGGDHYLAVVEGADHRYGGLVCGANEDPEQPIELTRASAATGLFLRAYAQGDDAAREALRQLPQFPMDGVSFEAK